MMGILTLSGDTTLTWSEENEFSENGAVFDTTVDISSDGGGNFILTATDDNDDLWAIVGSWYGRFLGVCFGGTDRRFDGFLGIAEEAIADTGTGTICTFGIPPSSTKTGMSEEKGWYATGSKGCPLILRDKSGSDGLVVNVLTPVKVEIIPAEVGDNAWMF